ncbi:Uncharacterized membrane protein [Nitrosomonas aestuarii]|uniref:Uncharacterized membrane protein n=1 Tax=Nitrosomonas aestuarii TaxID=52441 RepID=A0A1I4AKY0_9PROT|nr:DUF2254 domain-containing protein [Nitrosomonas aestuarii]SFK56850.1 Uncharacterized membrane protein [Nitrosomonas aestuarii]
MIRLFWEKLLTTIWFVPTIIATGLVITAIGLLSLDQLVNVHSWSWTGIFQIGTTGIRQVLVVTTGAIISLTGVVFSISVVALTLAANQFGSKILHNFLRDNKNKIVLGILIGSFLYGLTLLSFIDTHPDSTQQVPIISVIGSLLLTVLAVIGLIYFIHYISTTIQADQIISLIGQELNQAIEKTLLDLDDRQTIQSAKQKWDIATHALPVETVYAATSGYVEFIDLLKLNKIAEEENQHIELLLRPGHFVIESAPMMRIYDSEDISESYPDTLRENISLGRKRTPFSDIEFAIMQLLQIALRALSPGINDSLTAISCIDWLSSSLGRMTNKRFPCDYLEDQNGIIRLKKHEFGFADAADTMFHPLRQNARGNEMVMIHLLETISRILQVSKNSQYSQALFHHAELILEASKESFQSTSDKNEIIERFEKCQVIFEQGQKIFPDTNQSAI